GRTHHQAAVGDFLALGDQRVGADDAVLTDLRAVEHHGVDADQAVFADAAAMQHDLVADGHAFADRQRKAHVGVQHAAILDVGVLTNVDKLVVAAQHGVEPDAGAGLEADLADQTGVGSDPALRVGLDPGITQTVFHACS